MPGIFESDQLDSGLTLQELANSYFLAQADNVPFTALLPRGEKPSGFLMEQPMKKRARRPIPGMMDGVDQASYGHTNRGKTSMYAEDVRTKGWMATKHATLTKTGGVSAEAAEQEVDDGVELTQMIERLLLSDQDCQQENDPSQPYLTRGIFSWMDPAEQGVLPVPEAYRPAAGTRYSGAIDDFTPDDLEEMLIEASQERFEPVSLELFAGIRLKSRMSKWAQKNTDVSGETFIQRYNIDAAAKSYLRLVDHFEFEAGDVRTISSYYLHCNLDTGADTAYTPRSGVGIDMSNFCVRFLQEMEHQEQPDLGGGPRGFHDVVLALCAKNLLGQVSILSNS